jgi:hypothetical protein
MGISGKRVCSGVYHYFIIGKERSEIKKLVLIN